MQNQQHQQCEFKSNLIGMLVFGDTTDLIELFAIDFGEHLFFVFCIESTYFYSNLILHSR